MKTSHRILLMATLCFTGLALPAGAQQETELDSTTFNDEDLILPEGMRAAEIDSLLKDWTTRNHITLPEDCEPSNQNPLFSPEEYQSRLRRLPCVIDMPYNSVVMKYIDQYCTRLRQSVSIMLATSNFYTPIFEEALESYQLPLELKYLPVIESALNPQATSRVGAAGLWQFMITTGKQYGLEVNSLIDERRDPIKASYAAARYLKDLYDIFGDWTLVIASYNCGPNNINKGIKRSGGEENYWAIYPHLPAETRGYVPAFIAACYVMNFYCEHNICPATTTLPQATDTLVIRHNVYMDRIASMTGISMDELKALNPQYRTSLIPGEAHECILRMPTDKISAFISAGDSIYVQPSEIPPVIEPVVPEKKARTASTARKTITVRRGDTLGAIAKRNRTTVRQIQRLNGLKSTRIRQGQRLRVQ